MEPTVGGDLRRNIPDLQAVLATAEGRRTYHALGNRQVGRRPKCADLLLESPERLDETPLERLVTYVVGVCRE